MQNQNQNRANYINHTLNNSPSKNSYTFARSVRFPTTSADYYEQEGMNESVPVQSAYTFYSPSKKLRSRDRFDKYNSRSKSRSPKNKRNSPKWNKQGSPYKNNKYQNYEEERSPKKWSPNKNKHIVKSYRNGYYPYGIEINKNGKYYVSNYENVKSPSFGKAANRTFSYLQYNVSNDELGPGYYNVMHDSPGRYVTSTNRNNDAHKFSKSPRKINEYQVEQSNEKSSRAMYYPFSEFGPSKTR